MENDPQKPPYNFTQKDAREFRERGWLGKVLIVGTNFLAGPLVLGFAGHWIDKKTGHDHRFMLIGVLLGLIWATYEALKIAWYIDKESKKKND